MAFRDADRAQSIQLGALLIFSILIIFAAGYQAFAVPSQNAAVEQDHSERVQDQMQDVRSGIHTTAATGTASPANVKLAVEYPTRALFLNPSTGAGTVRTRDRDDVVLRNVTAIDDETADHWDGSDRSLRTNALVYRPSYSLLEDPPTTVYESTVLYDEFSDAAILETDQRIIDGRDINFVALQGEYQRSGTDTAAVEPRAMSPTTRTVAVEGDGGPIELEVPVANADVGTTLEDRLASEPNVVSASYAAAEEALTVELDETETYRLRLSGVVVGSGAPGADLQYLTDVEGDQVSVPEDSTHGMVLEARDGFDNPVSGESVETAVDVPGNCGASGDGTLEGDDGTTDEDGRLALTYEAPADISPTNSNTCEVTVSVGVGGTTPCQEQCVEFTVFVLNVDGN